MEEKKDKKLMIDFRTYDTVSDVLTSLQARGVKLSKNLGKNVHTFATECNYAGIPLHEAKRVIEKNFHSSTLLNIVDTVYKENADKFALKALILNLKIQNNHDYESNVGLKDFGKFPCVPIRVFQELPLKLQDDLLKNNFKDTDKEHAFILGASSALEGLFEWVNGVFYS